MPSPAKRASVHGPADEPQGHDNRREILIRCPLEVGPWRLISIVTLALATMVYWWPSGFAHLLQVPGFGLFRCPARYTVITSLGLCLLAGRGFNRTTPIGRFQNGLGIAGLYAVASFGWAFALPRLRPEFRTNLDDGAIAIRVGIAAATWAIAMMAFIVWRRRSCSAWILFALTTAEMAAFYHLAGTTQWGWPERLPEASRVLNLLANEPEARRVAGPLGNLPVFAGLSTGKPHTGFSLPMPNKVLQALEPRAVATSAGSRWLRRLGVTHLVTDEPLASSYVDEIFHGDDPLLDKLVYQRPGMSSRRDWRVYRIPDPFPPVRLGLRVHESPDLMSLVTVLSVRDGMDEAWYLAGDLPPPARFPRAENARIIQWDGLSGEVEHSGSVEVILCRAYYPGWEVSINNAEAQPALQSNGGLLTARLDGHGVSRLSFRYRPTGMTIAIAISAVTILVCLGILVPRRS